MEGRILFRSLSYFVALEEKGLRGDTNEGARRYTPTDGITVRPGANDSFKFQATMVSVVREDEIFVFCASTIRSAVLAEKFGGACIEIFDTAKFEARIQGALKKRRDMVNPELRHGLVRYYDEVEPSGTDWAFPHRIAMSKSRKYEDQAEYRFMFGLNGALRFQNTEHKLIESGSVRPVRDFKISDKSLKLGSVGRFFRLLTL